MRISEETQADAGRKPRRYIAIDLKSFYASVELADRKLDPLTHHLVVADPTRTEKTICLAVSPPLKAYGISGRARLFEVIEQVKKINVERFRRAKALGVLPRDPETGAYRFSGASHSAEALAADPSLALSYIVAPPRMMLYEKVSTQIFSIYAGYVSTEDIHVYSIDECFIDVTDYLRTYRVSAHTLAMRMIRDVLRATGITATAGIGTNMYLAKIAMDIVAKHVPADADGVRIAELDEQSYRERLWCHTPLTDFWRIGNGTARRLDRLGLHTMGDVARQSVLNENALYHTLGEGAELLIDHAWGCEPTGIADVKAYRPENRSLSSGQVLKEPYEWKKARLIVREMTDLLALDLVRKRVLTKKLELTVSYDRISITCAEGPSDGAAFRVTRTGLPYEGKVTTDPYGRLHPAHAHGTANLDRWTSSAKAVTDAMLRLFDRTVDPDLYVRRVAVVACGLLPEDQLRSEPEQLSLFTDFDALERERRARELLEAKERRIQQAALLIHERYGKNALLKGMNFLEGGTTRERNEQIGGHRAGTGEPFSVPGEAFPVQEEAPALGASALEAPAKEAPAQKESFAQKESSAQIAEARRGQPQTAARGSRTNEPDARRVYADIIDRARPQSARPRMSRTDRAVQFASYKSLSGYEDMVAEEARTTDDALHTEAYEQELLNRKLQRIAALIANGTHPTLTFTVYVPDARKAGGAYLELTDAVKRVDTAARRLVLMGTEGRASRNKTVDFDKIAAIRGDLGPHAA